jgi:serine/threonine-protein kinase
VIGTTLSHYSVIEVLGTGGMGVVYRAHDTQLERDVAIKVLSADIPRSQRSRLRFKREAMTASALSHPNIVTIFEISSQDNNDFIVMEYIRGITLSALLKSRRLTLDEALHYSLQVADGLAKAHAAHVIHRDLKPGNIMITDDGLVKLLDFGLAKLTRARDESSSDDVDRTKEVTLTTPGMVTGTVYYMSPEQARGDVLDARSDIFSLGTVIFLMLTGKLPFTGDNPLAILHSLHFSRPQDLAELCPGAPPELVSLVEKMLAKDPANRVQTMGEVVLQLRKCAGLSIDPSGTWQRSASWLPGILTTQTAARYLQPRSSIRRWGWTGVALLLLAAGIFVGQKWVSSRHTAQNAVSSANLEAPPEDNAFALYQRAQRELDTRGREGNLDYVVKLLTRAVQLDPQSAASYAALSEAYSIKNTVNPDSQWAKLSLEYANRAVSLDGYLAAAHNSLGLAKQQSGDTAGAEQEFHRAADLDPKSDAAHLWLGVLYARLGKPDLSNQELNRARALNPDDWRVYLNLGLDAYNAADYASAARNWEEVRKREPNSVTVLQNLGAVYHLLGRDDDAAAALQHALSVKPAADTYANLGTIRFYQGKYEDAVPAFEKAVQLAANQYDNWGNLGDAYRWTPGNAEKAKQAYAQAISLVREQIAKHPDQLDLHAYLGMYLAKSGSKKEAVQQADAVALSSNPDTIYMSAIIYEICGHREKALDALTRAVKAGQSLADIRNEPELTSLRADPRYHLNVLTAAAK